MRHLATDISMLHNMLLYHMGPKCNFHALNEYHQGDVIITFFIGTLIRTSTVALRSTQVCWEWSGYLDLNSNIPLQLSHLFDIDSSSFIELAPNVVRTSCHPVAKHGPVLHHLLPVVPHTPRITKLLQTIKLTYL